MPKATMAELKAEIASLKAEISAREIVDLRIFQGRAIIAKGHAKGAEWTYTLQAAYSDVAGLIGVKELSWHRDGQASARFYTPDAFKGAEQNTQFLLTHDIDRLNAESWTLASRDIRDAIRQREATLTAQARQG